MIKTFINIRKTTSKWDLEIMQNIADTYDYALELLQSQLKLHNVYIMLTNYDVRTNNSQIYRVEHRKRTMIKLNFEEIIEDYTFKLWKKRYSKEYLPKKLDTFEHSLFILFHEIAHYINKDHLVNWNSLSQIETIRREVICDLMALDYLKILKRRLK